MRDDESSLHHSALPPGLAPLRLLSAFWEESRRLAPMEELHVVDPYLLDARKEDPSRHASSIAQLLTPSLRNLSVITFVYRKESIDVRNALEAYVSQLAPSGLLVRFVKPSHFHHRWVVADRTRVALLDISFNQIGRALGGNPSRHQ